MNNKTEKSQEALLCQECYFVFLIFVDGSCHSMQ